MALFVFFKKKTPTEIIEPKIGISSGIVTYVSLEYERSRELMKEATAKSATDIDGAIRLLEEAIKVCPENADNFKLANYYHKAGQKEKAYSILEKRLRELIKKDLGMYNMNLSIVYEKLCTLTYKDNEFEKHLFNYTLWLHGRVTAMACQGRKEELKNLLSNQDKLEYLAPTKIKGSFKKLDKMSAMPEFNNRLNQYFASNENLLQEMAKKAHKVDSMDGIDTFRTGESVGERANRFLSRDSNFMEQYEKINSGQVNTFFENELRPLLKSIK